MNYRPAERLDVQIRWLIRRDMGRVLDIEHASFENPWSEEDFLCCLRQRNCIGMVAEHENEVVGFIIYELHKARLRVLNIAVAPDVRRSGVGTQIINRLIEKLSQQRRREVLLEVRESNLTAQLFYKAQGFRAVCVLRRHYEDTEEDGYVMRYQLTAEHESQSEFALQNRISEFYDAA
ncbi:MAG: ribosomal protein S18-alanine N-acetyltransferase [Planctomycetaceae bacterium]